MGLGSPHAAAPGDQNEANEAPARGGGVGIGAVFLAENPLLLALIADMRLMSISQRAERPVSGAGLRARDISEGVFTCCDGFGASRLSERPSLPVSRLNNLTP